MTLDDAFVGSLPHSASTVSGTILLVDDEEELRTMCCRALEQEGSTVVEAADGLVALGIVQLRRPSLDLVITDLKMPRLGGLELAEILSVFEPDLPVLAMTGDPGMADRRLPTLLKPFSPEELTEAARLMRGRAIAMRTWARERRARALKARQVAEEMRLRTAALRNRVDLVAVAIELQRLSRAKASNGVRNFSDRDSTASGPPFAGRLLLPPDPA